MKKIFLFLCFVIFISSSKELFSQRVKSFKKIAFDKNFSQCNEGDWVLVFEDTFNENKLDLKKWHMPDCCLGNLYGYQSNSQEYNLLENAIVKNGILNITAKRDTVTKKTIPWFHPDSLLEDGLPNQRPYYFTSSKIWTTEKFSYGKLEARVKIPKGKGFFPALWMFSGDPWCEIDVFEFWNEKNFFGSYAPNKNSKILRTTIHYDFDMDGSSNMVSEKHKLKTDFSEDFHIYTLIWENDKIEWYVDGKLIRTHSRYSYRNKPSDCLIENNKNYKQNLIFPNQPMHIILNFAIQNNKNQPDEKTILPNAMQVDWVRFYQRNTSSPKTSTIKIKKNNP